jgi:hypothetical protein
VFLPDSENSVFDRSRYFARKGREGRAGKIVLMFSVSDFDGAAEISGNSGGESGSVNSGAAPRAA